jgi:hypothetical protein
VDQMYLLLLAIAVIVAFAALVVMRARPRTPTTPEGNDSPFGVSTEGMKMCQKCGMGNLWTERRCSACGSPLRG